MIVLILSLVVALATTLVIISKFEKMEKQPGTWLLRHTKRMQNKILQTEVQVLDLNGYLHANYQLNVPTDSENKLHIETVSLDTLTVIKRENGLTYYSGFAVKAVQIIKSKKTPSEISSFGSRESDFAFFRDTLVDLVNANVHAFAIEKGFSESDIADAHNGKIVDNSELTVAEPIESVLQDDPMVLELEEERRVYELRKNELEIKMEAARIRLIRSAIRLKQSIIEVIEDSDVEMPNGVSAKALVDHDLGELILTTVNVTSSLGQESDFYGIAGIWNDYEIMPMPDSENLHALLKVNSGEYESGVLPLLALIHQTENSLTLKVMVSDYVRMLGDLAKEVMRVNDSVSQINFQKMKNLITHAAMELMVEFGVDVVNQLDENLDLQY